MLRKLLLLLLIGFAFTEVNAQSNIIINTNNCITGSDVVLNEFDYNGDVNSRVSYQRVTALTPMWWADYSPNSVVGGSGTHFIEWDGVKWIYRVGGTTIWQNLATSTLPPDSGWTYVGGCPSGDGTLALLESQDGLALPVNREEFSNIKIYPNPSNGFINISNLKENSRVVISNIAGQVVKDVVVGMNDNRIDIQDLSQGFYFVELVGKKTIKLLKR